MIKNIWYVILESSEVTKKPLRVKRLNLDLVLYRLDDGELICMENKCCHRGASLASGHICDNKLLCPFHGFEFDKEGNVTSIPANGKNKRVGKNFKNSTYKTHETNGFIYLFNGPKENATTTPKYFEGLDEFTYKTSQTIWKTHYTRCIENQLDVVHVPFVHKSTIGRGNKTLVNGPKIVWDEDLMTFYVFNEIDKGQTPLKSSEMVSVEDYFSLAFKMPNIWMNNISDKLKVSAAFVPVDDETTIIYLRFMQKFMPYPIIRNVVNYIGSKFNLKILHEDHEIVKDQVPQMITETMHENLIAGDLPITEFRKHYFELKRLNKENEQ